MQQSYIVMKQIGQERINQAKNIIGLRLYVLAHDATGNYWVEQKILIFLLKSTQIV